MQSVKRLEIVIGALQLKRVVQALQAAGAKGYTVIPGASGAGDRGIRWGDDPGGSSDNLLLICVVEIADEERIVGAVRPMLERFGGICLVTDAKWIHH
ncbi:P-II family nitrogen regulator [Engelhardtia mirabilis]|uniref:Nitrogen regulatory protein P-II n=1 Tax=Engelhardtia mirabilis TaxID=2528011 RepID=A0A518BED4_9BACT|nr:hypothetical protein Pla133_04060 [Planctomycetes bacterium Pla133]QDU99667.1 hypothetical protein Pla86_04060 [Planctomycetes bacterium Pla86]